MNKALKPIKDATPALFEDFSNADSGLQGVEARDLIIPRLTVLQALSPQLNKKRSEYVEGAEAGMICDVATGDVWEAIDLIFCQYSRAFLEWAPRSSGTGLIANHGRNPSILEKCTVNDRRQHVTAEGNIIAETAQWFCLNLTAGGRRSFLPLASTGLKVSRQLMMKIMAEKLADKNGAEFTPPIYFRSWKAEVTSQSNNQGEWYSWRFTPGEVITTIDPSKKLLVEAKKFCAEANEGKVTGAHEETEDASERM
jgi:hypothetical protein